MRNIFIISIIATLIISSYLGYSYVQNPVKQDFMIGCMSEYSATPHKQEEQCLCAWNLLTKAYSTDELEHIHTANVGDDLVLEMIEYLNIAAPQCVK